jgi:hypothetical protein
MVGESLPSLYQAKNAFLEHYQHQAPIEVAIPAQQIVSNVQFDILYSGNN